MVWLLDQSGEVSPSSHLRDEGAHAASKARGSFPKFDVAQSRRFVLTTPGHALGYLMFWKSDHDAVRQMRYVLHRCGHSAAVSACSDDEVIRALAAKIARGQLVLTESAISPPPMAGLPLPVPPPAVAEAPPLETLPEKVPPPPLLPIVEAVQIEGAEVLPEVLQALEKIDLSLENIDLTGVSLQPAPTKIPLIVPAMRGASQSVTTVLDEL